jgi:hypothetical protein
MKHILVLLALITTVYCSGSDFPTKGKKFNFDSEDQRISEFNTTQKRNSIPLLPFDDASKKRLSDGVKKIEQNRQNAGTQEKRVDRNPATNRIMPVLPTAPRGHYNPTVNNEKK